MWRPNKEMAEWLIDLLGHWLIDEWVDSPKEVILKVN